MYTVHLCHQLWSIQICAAKVTEAPVILGSCLVDAGRGASSSEVPHQVEPKKSTYRSRKRWMYFNQNEYIDLTIICLTKNYSSFQYDKSSCLKLPTNKASVNSPM